MYVCIMYACVYVWKYSTGQKTVFTRSAVTPPKVNRFGYNLEHSELTLLGLALADFGRDAHSSDSLREVAKILFLFLSTN